MRVSATVEGSSASISTKEASSLLLLATVSAAWLVNVIRVSCLNS